MMGMPGVPPIPGANPAKQAAAKPTEQTTTVYVGKIPPTVEDEFIRKLLEVWMISTTPKQI